MSLQVVSTVRRDNVQVFTKRRFSALFLTYKDVSRCKFSHRRTCMYATFHIRNHVRDHWFDPREGLWCVYLLWKNVPLCNFLTYMDVSACKFSHERTCLYTTCAIISYVWARPTCFHAVVHYKTCSCACSHTKRRVSAHFLSYEVISMRNVKHITPRWSPNFP